VVQDIMFLYGWGPEEDGRLSSLLYIVETAAAMGMKTAVFFFTDGAILGKKGTCAKISEEIDRRFKSIVNEKKSEILVCKETLEEGLTIIGYATFLDLATKAKTVITI
jgi:predicted peroxiredoxin